MYPPIKYIIYILVLLITYFLLFYFSITQQLNEDFSSFYSAALEYLHQRNPYQELSSAFLTNSKQLAINLNPPFFLLLISSLTYFSYPIASLIWQISSLILGIIGSLICFYLTTNPAFFKKNLFYFILLYLSAYATLMNTNFNQVAGLLLFLIMSGYYFFLQHQDYKAGLFWGLAIALKLFPGLLFIFALNEKRYKLFWTMLAVFLLAWSLPFLVHGWSIYILFLKTINNLLWYGNSWNASIYGMLFRLFVAMDEPFIIGVKISYQIIFLLLLLVYVKKLNQCKFNPHQGFCLTLIMMLLMSPFGWMYYFSLVLMPLIIIYQGIRQTLDNKKIALWCLCLFFLNAPIANLQTKYIDSFFAKITIYSVYFYGLLLTLYLFLSIQQSAEKNNPLSTSNPYVQCIELVLSFGVLMVLGLLLLGHYW